MTPYFDGGFGLSSILSLAMVISLPDIAAPISSSAGAIILQGEHHSAQEIHEHRPCRRQDIGLEG